MNLYYGNVNFKIEFEKHGIACTEIDFATLQRDPRDTGQTMKDIGKQISEALERQDVVLLTNIQGIKLFYEHVISRSILKSDEKYLVLGELRWDFYRELKLSFSKFLTQIKEMNTANRIIWTAPMVEDKECTIISIKPGNWDDFDKYTQQFDSIIPFIQTEKGIEVYLGRSLHKNVTKKKLEDYIKMYEIKKEGA